MKNQVFLILLGLLTGFSSFAQQEKVSSFFTEVAYDTAGIDEQFEIKFTLKNAQAIANFEAPGFDGLQIIAGPMTSQQTSIINGDMTQSMSYSFIVKPTDMGIFNIPSASIETEKGILVSDEVAIVIVESINRPRRNDPFNNAFQDPFSNNPFFNDPFFNQGTTPRKGMDDLMKEFNEMFELQAPPGYHYDSKKAPAKKPKKKEKVYKI